MQRPVGGGCEGGVGGRVGGIHGVNIATWTGITELY